MDVGMLGLGFALGLAHAFDADHLVAVSSLAARNRRGHSLAHALRWGIGHGGVLMAVAAAALVLGWQLPTAAAQCAEKLVGVILIAAGVSLCWRLWRDRVQVQIHQHGALVHAHRARPRTHRRAPVLVGSVHGLAGSAPALALLPATLQAPAVGLAYLLLFCAGVLAGMAGFGLVLGRGQHWLGRWPPLLACARTLLGLGAAALGIIWLST